MKGHPVATAQCDQQAWVGVIGMIRGDQNGMPRLDAFGHFSGAANVNLINLEFVAQVKAA